MIAAASPAARHRQRGKDRKRFSKLLGVPRKTDSNTGAASAKILIRQNVFDMVPAPRRVFDAYAGAGEMWRGVWNQADHYVGCDKKWFRDDRAMFVSDCLRVMRAIDLREFNLFDFDAYGSPWDNACILAARRAVEPGERIGVVITDGTSLSIRFAFLPAALAEISGMRGMPGLARHQEELIDRALQVMADRMKSRIIRKWRAIGTTGARVRYVGIVLEGQNV